MNEETLKHFNELWAVMEMRPLTQEEFDNELKQHPDLLKSYSLQEQVAKKYRD